MNKFPHLKKYLEVLLHLSLWLLIFGFIQNNIQDFWLEQYQQMNGIFGEDIDPIDLQNWQATNWNLEPYIRFFLLVVFKAIFFYLNVYLIFPRYQRNQIKWKVFGPLLFNLAWCFLLEAFFFIAYFKPRLYEAFLYNYNEFESGIAFLMMLVTSFAYWSAKQWLLNQDEFEKAGKTNAELALLKNQINPHFLFNTLNNLFSMAIERKADDLAESISQLTHLMRYSIYESRTEYIELHREIEYIENYIKLQELRFSSEDAVSIRFQVQGENQAVRIAPMLLINFVENAFKHGVSLKQPSLININLTTTDDQIAFTVENTIFRQNKNGNIAHAGFGLEHTKKLLQMQYPHRHQLQITEENNIFRVALILKLQKTKVEVMAWNSYQLKVKVKS